MIWKLAPPWCFCPDKERTREAEQVWEDNVFSVKSGLVGCVWQWSRELGQGKGSRGSLG